MAAQGIAALKRAIKQSENRLDALDKPKLERLNKIEQTVKEGFAEHGALINLLLKQRADDRALADQRRTIADQRHAEIMAQFEKLLAKRPEN